MQSNAGDPLAEKSDLFSTAEDDEPMVASPTEVTNPTNQAAETFEELPIEIRSLTERYHRLSKTTVELH